MKRLLVAAVFVLLSAEAIANTPLISSDWLRAKKDAGNIIVIDLRNKIDGGGIEVFRKGHIPGSIHSDYLKAGWRVKRNGVPGLLPEKANFEKLVGGLGISNESHVVLVPAGVSSTDFGSAARAYWQFKVYGHEQVSILNGGFAAWKSAFPDKIEVGNGIKPTPASFNANLQPGAYLRTQDIARLSTDREAILLDGRNEAQWKGKAKHPAARSPGRIPGSTWAWQGNTYDDTANQLKGKIELAKLFKEIEGKPVVSYCNTGHWAATNWFALSEVLGRKDVDLYDASMTGWTSNPDLPLVTEQTKLDDLKDWFKKKLN